MNITFRRHFWLIIVFVLVIGTCLLIGSTRLIAYNFGEGNEIEAEARNYDNEIYIFDDSVIHEIEIDLNQSDYDSMIKIFQDTGAKDYFQTDITIDGVTIPNVGVRLKGNLTLSQTVGGSMSGPGGGSENGGGMRGFKPPEDFEFPEGLLADLQAAGLEPPSDTDIENMIMPQRGMNMELPENWEEMTEEERQEHMGENGRGMGGGPMGGEGNGENPPFLVKFDEFVPGQTYQEFAEIAIRLGSDKSLLGEPVAFHIHRETGQIAPETAYAVIQTAENEASLYVICEHIDEKYIEKHFPNSEGILYKAGNFVGFEYKGEDPTLYTDLFEQKTNVNDDDLAPLIRFMKFVSESSDEAFETELSNWLDMDSFIRMMALDNLLDNNDSFVGMGSNYYLYYDKDTKKFAFLSWDMNLAMGSMGGMMQSRNTENGAPRFGFEEGAEELTESEAARQEIFEKWLQEGGFGGGGDQAGRPGRPGGRDSTNVLKERFFANETFSQMYDIEYAKLKELIFEQSQAAKKTLELSQVFTNYNNERQIIDQDTYNAGVERILNFLEQKASEFK